MREEIIVYPVIENQTNAESSQHLQEAQDVYQVNELPQTNETVSKSISLIGLLIVAIALTVGVYRKLKVKGSISDGR
ncbi:TPA: LPXTG cell wall anchor domain-containing protein [Enterococcus faecium]|uniref:LPXTG cell wall anchor domain-containing protein n=1 Tax=Enterococcus faecalis TaxID=1351 RepID=UPI000A5FD165|nr:LPXTG cell wall anchor domain-containing protein [Enterococcus faecalis]MDV4498653.1 LPXTG cell wall anchor domain-containing protein [Enterococcus faecium]MCE2569418.1 LPXTG cell wall anchor domain-containing protein [Enterococcus faecalis]HAQ2240598.1 LPXTG cell wall anchor domain-containing protein [Enterococcus faecium]HAQ6403695.1 LPXTG cell wall anchor domain-containing protein [Enterococcus faecium]HAQ6450778.1 LPXTG cell wall anchor domain-containing protein [Enterococcus faecium]